MEKHDPIMAEAIAARGWYLHRAPRVPLRQFQVFGERGSGTNLVRRLLNRSFTIQRSDALGWKHGVPSMAAIPADMLIVVVQRNLFDWARSLHRRPWHGHPEIQALPFDAFIRAPWRSVIDRPSHFAPLSGPRGALLQYDRHPITGAAYETIFEMRAVKSEAWLGFRNRGCALLYVQLEMVQEDPEAWLNAIRQALSLEWSDTGYRPVQKRLGTRFTPAIDPRPATPETWCEEDRAFAIARADWAQEALFGYEPGE